MSNNILLSFSSVLLTLLFFLSGFHKISDFANVTKGLMKKTNLPLPLAKISIVLVILLEIIAPFIITVYSYTSANNLKQYTKISILALIAFTILATFIYHFPPYASNYYSFMSNLSTIGGLIILYMMLFPL
jgi:uncharacterized membrane protein YphA (DoxX/SURF4 family)